MEKEAAMETNRRTFDRVREYVASNHIDEALGQLTKHLGKNLQSSVILLTSRWKSLEEDRIRGLLVREEARTEHSRIALAILGLAEELLKTSRKDLSPSPNSKAKPTLRRRSPRSPNSVDVLILTALAVECEAVLRHVRNVREVVHPRGSVYQVGVCAVERGYRSVAVLEVGPGNVNTAVEVERAVGRFAPRYCFFVGIAGGIKDVKVGDVVAATKVYAYESGKDGRTFMPRPDVWRPSDAVISRARVVSRNGLWLKRVQAPGWRSGLRSFVKPIAAGEKVVSSKRSAPAKLLQSNYGDALAVEMEGAGFLLAAYKAEVSGIVIRGISDLLKAPSDLPEEDRQTMAARSAAAFAFEVLHAL